MGADPFSEHTGWRRTFVDGSLTLGIVLPAEATCGGVPSLSLLTRHARLADRLGFAALWVRDLTLLDPELRDHGQLLDPFVTLAQLCTVTEEIALGAASIVLPTRHPLHVAKAAASIDLLSNRRLLLGVGNGWRPVEYEAVGLDYATRGARFEASFSYLAALLAEGVAEVRSPLGRLTAAAQMVPRPAAPVPLLLTGECSLPPERAAEFGDGRIWIADPARAREYAELARWARPERFCPYVTLLRVDVDGEPGSADGAADVAPPVRRLTTEQLLDVLAALRAAHVHHVMLDLRWSTRSTEDVLATLAQRVLPLHPSPRGLTAKFRAD